MSYLKKFKRSSLNMVKVKSETNDNDTVRQQTYQEMPYDIRVQLYPRIGDICEVRYPDLNYKGRTMGERKHKDLMIDFAKSPEGTGVWCKRIGEKRWIKQYTPSWLPQNLYVLDDNNAEQNKKELDEKCGLQ